VHVAIYRVLFWYWELNSGLYHLSHAPSPLVPVLFLRWDLPTTFARAGLKLKILLALDQQHDPFKEW
jgi:hypothetical protein